MVKSNPDTAPIRILEVVDTLDAGGMEAQLVSLINRLDPAQYRFEVCCLRHAGVHAARLNAGIPVHTLTKTEGFQWGVVRQLRQILSRGFDLVHTHNLAALIYVSLATMGGRTCPIFHGEHSQFSPQERDLKRLWQRRILYRGCAAVHTVSAGQRQELISTGVRHPRLTAILNGVDTQRFRSCSDPSQRIALRRQLGIGEATDFVVGIVARFGAFKGHAALIRAFESVAVEYPAVRLVMVGSGGPCEDQVLEQANNSVVHDRIHWTGYQSDPVPWYQTMDLLAVPSQNEGLSNATLEAMACGVPVLSNDICGARELLSDSKGGWVRDLGSEPKIAEALRDILQLPGMVRESMGRLGEERANAAFSWQRMADTYAAWFAACAGRKAFPA